MRAAVAVIFMGMLMLATMPADTEAFLWRDIRRVVDNVINGLDKFWNKFQGYFDGINWNDAAQITAALSRIDCATLCPNCDALPNNNGKTICRSYCTSTCFWQYKRSLDEDYLSLDQLKEAVAEE